jgi:predicted nuclease of restriction endonuclease-like RecB superfamily
LESVVAKRLGRRARYESEKIKYFETKHYVPDFVIRIGEKKIFLEVKGFLRYEDQRKMKMVKACNPDLDIRFYFPKEMKIHRSNMTNVQWCNKYDYPYCIGSIPSGWLQ